MTNSVYVIGGAGTGKSTLMDHLLDVQLGWTLGELEDFHAKRNRKNLVTLRGQRCYEDGADRGVYLGLRREEFPGTDALDRVSGTTAVEWLELGNLPPVIIGEGINLSGRPFLRALHAQTDALIVHLVASEATLEERFSRRGSSQKQTFVSGSVTRAANVARDMRKLGAWVETFDTTREGPEGIAPLIDFHLSL